MSSILQHPTIKKKKYYRLQHYDMLHHFVILNSFQVCTLYRIILSL